MKPLSEPSLASPQAGQVLMELQSLRNCIDRALARIDLSLDGTVIDANENYLKITGYSSNEIIGKHHRMFVTAEQQASKDYAEFWQRLRKGESFNGQFKRIAKGGNIVWIEASYLPYFRPDGQCEKIVKFASDITAVKKRELQLRNYQDAVEQQFAIIQFSPDGIIQSANQNFLQAVGYRLEDLVGKHHRIFVKEEDRNSAEYARFWTKLAAGERLSGDFRRMDKHGKEFWIHASFNPIRNSAGAVENIVKYSTNITSAVENRQRASVASQSISGSVTQFATTIDDISSSVGQTVSLSQDTKNIVEDTVRAVQGLDDSSRVIGRVVEVIQELAEQTNLLALNATIESARAGEAGRGFAVVASAVKDLAKQTATATKDINTTVQEIQGKIDGVVDCTRLISERVSQVNDKMTSISSAVEQQSLAVQSISQTALQLQELNQSS
ncbi:MAG: PAS domain-containing methyl-accepting chemotaxis protein [Pirellula sp.]